MEQSLISEEGFAELENMKILRRRVISVDSFDTYGKQYSMDARSNSFDQAPGVSGA